MTQGLLCDNPNDRELVWRIDALVAPGDHCAQRQGCRIECEFGHEALARDERAEASSRRGGKKIEQHGEALRTWREVHQPCRLAHQSVAPRQRPFAEHFKERLAARCAGIGQRGRESSSLLFNDRYLTALGRASDVVRTPEIPARMTTAVTGS